MGVLCTPRSQPSERRNDKERDISNNITIRWRKVQSVSQSGREMTISYNSNLHSTPRVTTSAWSGLNIKMKPTILLTQTDRDWLLLNYVRCVIESDYNGSGGLWCTPTVHSVLLLDCKRVGRTVRSVQSVQSSVQCTLSWVELTDMTGLTKLKLVCGPLQTTDPVTTILVWPLKLVNTNSSECSVVSWTLCYQSEERDCVFVFLPRKVEQLVAGPSHFIPELSWAELSW